MLTCIFCTGICGCGILFFKFKLPVSGAQRGATRHGRRRALQPRHTRLRDDGRTKPKYPAWETGPGYMPVYTHTGIYPPKYPSRHNRDGRGGGARPRARGPGHGPRPRPGNAPRTVARGGLAMEASKARRRMGSSYGGVSGIEGCEGLGCVAPAASSWGRPTSRGGTMKIGRLQIVEFWRRPSAVDRGRLTDNQRVWVRGSRSRFRKVMASQNLGF